jgi:hypothetical protein
MYFETDQKIENFIVYSETRELSGPNIFTFRFRLSANVNGYHPTELTSKVGRFFLEFPTLDYDGSTTVFDSTDFIYNFANSQDNVETSNDQIGCWINSEARHDDIPLKCRLVRSPSESPDFPKGAPIRVEVLNFKPLIAS